MSILDGIRKEAASLKVLYERAMPILKRNTTNKTHIARPIFGNSIDVPGVMGLTNREVSYMPKKLPYPLLPGATKAQKAEGYRLRNILNYAHEAVERKYDKLPWDKAPRHFWSHYGVHPILAEHNIVRTMTPKLSPNGKMLKTITLNRPDIIALERLYPGFKFGQSDRLSRHAIKRMQEIFEITKGQGAIVGGTP